MPKPAAVIASHAAAAIASRRQRGHAGAHSTSTGTSVAAAALWRIAPATTSTASPEPTMHAARRRERGDPEHQVAGHLRVLPDHAHDGDDRRKPADDERRDGGGARAELVAQHGVRPDDERDDLQDEHAERPGDDELDRAPQERHRGRMPIADRPAARLVELIDRVGAEQAGIAVEHDAERRDREDRAVGDCARRRRAIGAAR